MPISKTPKNIYTKAVEIINTARENIVNSIYSESTKNSNHQLENCGIQKASQ